MLARVLESNGLATVSISMVREHTERVRPPRALYVPFPFGYALGRPLDADLQHRVLRACFELLQFPEGPVLKELGEDGGLGEFRLPYPSTTLLQVDEQRDPAFEVTALRPYYERWLGDGARTAVGLAGVPPRRFRGLIRFLEAYVRGEQSDMRERPADMPLHQYIKYATDDLRNFCLEARLGQKPHATGEEVNRWFWSETAISRLIRQVAGRMGATDDPVLRQNALNIAR